LAIVEIAVKRTYASVVKGEGKTPLHWLKCFQEEEEKEVMVIAIKQSMEDQQVIHRFSQGGCLITELSFDIACIILISEGWFGQSTLHPGLYIT